MNPQYQQQALTDERRQYLAATNAKPALKSNLYGRGPQSPKRTNYQYQPQQQVDINQKALQMVLSGHPGWAEKLTKREVAKFVEHVAV